MTAAKLDRLVTVLVIISAFLYNQMVFNRIRLRKALKIVRQTLFSTFIWHPRSDPFLLLILNRRRNLDGPPAHNHHILLKIHWPVVEIIFGQSV